MHVTVKRDKTFLSIDIPHVIIVQKTHIVHNKSQLRSNDDTKTDEKHCDKTLSASACNIRPGSDTQEHALLLHFRRHSDINMFQRWQ